MVSPAILAADGRGRHLWYWLRGHLPGSQFPLILHSRPFKGNSSGHLHGQALIWEWRQEPSWPVSRNLSIFHGLPGNRPHPLLGLLLFVPLPAGSEKLPGRISPNKPLAVKVNVLSSGGKRNAYDYLHISHFLTTTPIGT